MTIQSQTWTLWFTGLHCSGKTTISQVVAQELRKKGVPVILLDGDEVRKTLSSDLGYSLEDRNAHMKRVADLCKIINDNGVLVIACVASPTKQSREYAQQHIPHIFTIYTKCSLEECEKRDVKGHYQKARNNEPGFESFLGISLPFEEPTDSDLILETENTTVTECLRIIMEQVKQKEIAIE